MVTTVMEENSGSDDAEGVLLKNAVRKFNDEAREHSIGKEQTPLTEDEVIASIRAWDKRNRPSDETFAVYRAIANSRRLPPHARIYSRDTWSDSQYVFTVWCIDLHIKTGENRGYAFRIRDQKISSRELTDDEIAKWKRLKTPE